MCATTGGTFYLTIEPDLGQERFLTDDPPILFANGNFSRVPMIIGRTSEEETSAAEGSTLIPQFNHFELRIPTTFPVRAFKQSKA